MVLLDKTPVTDAGYLLASLMKRREDASQERQGSFFLGKKTGVGKKLGRVAQEPSTEKNHHFSIFFPFEICFFGGIL